MAKQVSLKASSRTGVGRTQVKKTRAALQIPGIIYGSHIKPLPIQMDAKEVGLIFKHSSSENMLVDLSLDENGKISKRLAFIQETQRHPTEDYIMHMDLHEIKADEKIHVRVPVLAKGEPEGVRTGGGVLEQLLRELEVECLPKDLPDLIEVDVSALQIGGNIHVRDVKVPAGIAVISHAEVSLFIVQAPKEETAAPVAAEGAAGEPELIKKKAEDGEAAPEAKGDAKAAAKPAADAKAEAKPAAKAEKK
jgi:large subunit ribosomal protein L25